MGTSREPGRGLPCFSEVLIYPRLYVPSRGSWKLNSQQVRHHPVYAFSTLDSAYV